MGRIRVLHVDDHVAFSEKLHEILESHVDWVGAVYEADGVLTKVMELVPEVVLLDISMPGKNGFALAREIRASTSARVIFVSVQGDAAYVEEAFRAGASGYVLKSSVASDILIAVSEVHAGRTFVSSSLTRRRGPGGFSGAN
ncbi:MAG TPA: response regulator transcription factor [Vicinamibacteria bacterium]|nr:response regulator transcription factor [Vicinamibacteria bacterium]